MSEAQHRPFLGVRIWRLAALLLLVSAPPNSLPARGAVAAAPLVAAETLPVFHPVDCSQFVKKWDQFGANDCWAVVPRGLNRLGDVPFQMDGVLEVTGLGSARDGRGFYPTRVTGIPVGQKGHRLHLLTGTGYNAPEDTPIAKLLAHYADGSAQAFYIRYGVHTRNWWRERVELDDKVSDPSASVVWSYTEAPWNLRLYKTTFHNPHPEREIKTLDLFSLLSRATPVVVAITLEEDRGASAAPATATAALDESACRRELRLRFVDQHDRPVAGAVASLSLTDAGRTFGYGTNRADARGELVVDYPADQVRELAVNVRAPSCLPTRLSLTNAAPGNLALEQVVKLEAGVKIGGLVRAAAGLPIAGARVSVNTVAKDEVGQAIEQETDVATTDAAGRWTSASVSAGFKSLTFKLTHPDFRPAEYYMSDAGAGGAPEGSKADLLAGKAVMVMEPGVVVAGTVTDDAGKPLGGVEVLLRDSSDPPKDRFTQTDAAGRFKFVVMETGEGTVAVAAKGFSPQSAAVTFESELKPLSLKLEAAKAFHGRVVDEAGKPIARATVTLASWKELAFPKWHDLTDAKGRFSWDSAPADGAVYSITAQGYQPEQSTASPGDDEVIFTLKGVPGITGTVVDAETKAPIKQFQVIIGRSYGQDSVNWDRFNPMRGSDGKYFYAVSENVLLAREFRLLVEADGYLPQTSLPFELAGWLTNNFELKKGQGPRGVVKLPNGQPAAGVPVALLTGDYVLLKNQTLDFRGGRRNGFATTDAEGKFALPAAHATRLVAASRQGYAEAPLEQLDTTLTLTLQPWGRIEGVVRNGRRPATNQWVMVVSDRGASTAGLQYDFEAYRVQADDQGRFVLADVPPGERYLVRLTPMQGNRGWMWSHGETITVRTGALTQVTFGGKGRTVIGKVVPNEPREIAWQSGHHMLGTPQPRPPPTARTAAELRAWSEQPEVKEARAHYRYYSVTFDDDGSFRAEEVPPGHYELNFYFTGPPGQGDSSGAPFRAGALVGSLRQEFDVPEMPNGPVAEPLDLGRLDFVVQRAQ